MANQMYLSDGLVIHSNVTNCVRFLDYDPNVEPHGLVICDEFRNILPNAQRPSINWDHWLLQKTPTIYFVTFQRTVEEHDQQLRQRILNQLELDQEFTYERILDLYLHEVCQGRKKVVYNMKKIATWQMQFVQCLQPMPFVWKIWFGSIFC